MLNIRLSVPPFRRVVELVFTPFERDSESTLFRLATSSSASSSSLSFSRVANARVAARSLSFLRSLSLLPRLGPVSHPVTPPDRLVDSAEEATEDVELLLLGRMGAGSAME